VSDDLKEFESDFATLAKLAVQRSEEDVRLLLGRLVRKYRQRHPELAEQINLSLKSIQTRSESSALRRESLAEPAPSASVPLDRESRLELLKEFDDRSGMSVPLLPSGLLRRVESIIQERQSREILLARGLAPTRSAILVGPPGLGKTMSARWIASRLGKPLWVLDLTTVMSSMLGKTGVNLRAALDYAKRHSAILLLDEIDSIAKRRSDESDIGELKRLVTVILQEVDHWPDTGLLLAATNHPELIDPALWRRFDAELRFTAPDAELTVQAVRRFLGPDIEALGQWIDTIANSLYGRSLSDVERAVTTLRRGHALRHATDEELVSAMVGAELGVKSKAERLTLAVEMARAGKHTHQEINRLTGVARDTIRKHAGPSLRRGRGMK
jgi:SpoVK/Ycf46/Vps4 family AAA+-type ATPase